MKDRILNLFVEVTHTDQSDLNTGIQRVVRNVLHQLMQVGAPNGVNVYPVVFFNDRFVTIPADEVLRDRAADAAAPFVEVDQKISFLEKDRPRKYFVSGWAIPEPWGTWSVGKRAIVRFRIVPGATRPTLLRLNIGAFCCPELPEQRAEVLVNGQSVAQVRFLWGEHRGATLEAVIPIPDQSWEHADGKIDIEFLTPDARSPLELGVSEDSRALGVKLLELELSTGSGWRSHASGMDGQIDVSSSGAMRSINVADLVAPQSGQTDVLLLLDSSWTYEIWPAVRGLKQRGVYVFSVIYDLIPITHPHTSVGPLVSAFRKWLQEQANNADAVICISKYVAETVRKYLIGCGTSRNVPVTWFHLGAEPDFAISTGEVVSSRVREIAGGPPFFLMVGTIEPRKNHRQVFAAFDRAWRQGFKAQLVIVGARAWKTEQLLEEMHVHAECGARLHLVRDASDVDLDFLYRRAIALIIASEVEGFGLPIVEARQRGLRVIASDIPVFREIEDPATLFFDLGDVQSLVDRLLEIAATGKQTVQAEGGSWMTWRESTEELLSRIRELLGDLPAKVQGHGAGAPRMSRMLLRLRAWSRRSRVIVTSEGSVPPDPYDPVYALLSVQAKRIALSRLVGELQAGPARRWPKIAVCILLRYFDLRLSLVLASALIAERSLARMSAGAQPTGTNEASRRKA